MSEYVDTAEACEMTRLTRRTLMRRAQEHHLSIVRSSNARNSKILWKREELEAMLAQGTYRVGEV